MLYQVDTWTSSSILVTAGGWGVNYHLEIINNIVTVMSANLNC